MEKGKVKLNLQELEVFTDISKVKTKLVDIRESLANVFYTRAEGIKMHTIAEKIYKSEGAIEYSKDEIELIIRVVNQVFYPNQIEAINLQLKS